MGEITTEWSLTRYRRQRGRPRRCWRDDLDRSYRTGQSRLIKETSEKNEGRPLSSRGIFWASDNNIKSFGIKPF